MTLYPSPPLASSFAGARQLRVSPLDGYKNYPTPVAPIVVVRGAPQQSILGGCYPESGHDGYTTRVMLSRQRRKYTPNPDLRVYQPSRARTRAVASPCGLTRPPTPRGVLIRSPRSCGVLGGFLGDSTPHPASRSAHHRWLRGWSALADRSAADGLGGVKIGI